MNAHQTRLGMRLGGLVLVVVLVLDSCERRNVVGPQGGREPGDLAAAVVPGAGGVAGCARFEVAEGGHGPVSIEPVDTTATAACGSLRIRIEPPVVSGGGRTSLLVHVTNGGSAAIRAPLLVLAWEDSLYVENPPGLATNKHTGDYLTYMDADSSIADSAQAFPGALVWRLDSFLVAGAGAPQLAPGATSGSRDITISVHSGVHRFAFTLWATAAAVGGAVPATAPDSEPQRLYDPANRTSDPRWPGAPFMRGIILMRFQTGAGQAERQAAVDSVQGEVVGGLPFGPGEGMYLVQLPPDPTNDRMFAAMRTLNAMPQVSWAVPNQIYVGAATSLRPTDGAGMRRADWRLDPDSAFGNVNRPTWALEAVDAPLAWGCIQGDTTRVGVIDMGIHPGPDLRPNVASESDTVPMDPFVHGTDVASVLAARGDNGTGITGMMWRARLELHDVAHRLPNRQPQVEVSTDANTHVQSTSEVMSQSRLFNAMGDLYVHGARVISISLGTNAPATGPHTPASDSVRAAFAHIVAAQFGGMATPPLWVLSAGNLTVAGDAYFNQFTALADSLPALVVTGAGGTAGSLSPDATGRGAIDIAAPGEHVAVIDTGAAHAASGSSFATPLVAGAAGLLFSWDPSLSAAQARQYLIAGADSGRRRAGNFPLLDVYWSLRLAAGRTGAPVCGNRVFVDQQARLTVERDPMGGPPTDEVIPDQSASGSLVFFIPVHDGRYISVFDGDSDFTMVHQNGGWIRENVVPDSIQNTWVRSFAIPDGLVSHYADTTLLVQQNPPPNFGFTLSVRDSTGQVHAVATLPWFHTGQAYPMIGDEILVSVAASNSSGLEESIMGVNLHTGTVRTLFTRPAGSLATILVATEDGREFVAEYTTPFPDFTTCVTEYHSMSTGALTRRITQPNGGDGCTATWLTHGMRNMVPGGGGRE
ncbi:MAG TPA: S8 family serine peptidase [Gemmatimonadaceae bacterium]|nr:S8 family serine peptidase [Gemmatimonadaceae bacterium]